MAKPGFFRRLEPQLFQPIQHFVLTLRAGALDAAQAVENNAQRAFGHDARVQLLEGAGGGIAGIGENFLARRRAFFIKLLKTGARHINFAPHFHTREER
jgi:hypothetical protein